MSGIEPPSDLLARALQAEKTRPEPDARTRDHVLVRVVTTATIAGAAGIAAGTAEAATHAASSVADQATTVAATKGGVLTAKVVALVAATFAGGAVTGAAVHAVVATPTIEAPSPVLPPPVVSVMPVPPTSASAPADSTGAIPSASSAEPPSPAASKTASGQDSDLSTERAMIERARTALMRGQHAAALETLAMHAEKFPRGRLSQEREVLTIHALVGVGRRSEAEARAKRFRQRHPNSPMLAAIDAVLPPGPAASSSE